MRAGDLVYLRHALVPDADIWVASYDSTGWKGGRYPAGTLAVVSEVHDSSRDGHSMESYAIVLVEGNRGYVWCYECQLVCEEAVDAAG